MRSIKDFGQTKIAVSPDTGLTIHANNHMHQASANRLFKSKRFAKLPKGREVIKEGEVIIFAPKKFGNLKIGDNCMCPDVVTGNYFNCKKISGDTCKVFDMGRLIPVLKTMYVLVEKVFSYSFTIKTSNMAQKTAPKKAAPKAKGKAVKASDGGPGKIEQIIALHKQGYSNKEIAEKGFNKTTISIQVSKFKRAKEAAKGAKKKAAA